MVKQEFIDLGISEEQAQEAEKASKKELEGYIPMHRFEEVNSAKKKLEEDLKQQAASLEELKNSAGNEELETKIKELQEEAKERDKAHKQEMQELRLSNAVKTAIAGKVMDEELVAGLFDKSKLILGEDGKVTGLDEQLKSLQESKAFLFKQEEQTDKPPAFHKVGAEPPRGEEGGQKTLREALAAKFNS